MLTAHRFTTVPTQSTRTRLESAQANERPIARGESHHGAVVAIQYALADLNKNYLLSAEVDGYFGPRTEAAVEAFQRDYGLVADGIVGRQTLTQLDALYNSDVIRTPVGRSVHIGVDRLDAGHYGGEFALASCVNDARKMREIAESLGYSAATLENEQATVTNFTSFMRAAIADSYAGDSVMISFSGHGSQMLNTSDDDESDMRDETLCFHDRMLLDDEFYSLLGQFREGVRVHAVFDSCHSGTVAKYLAFDMSAKDIVFKQEQDAYSEKTLTNLKDLSTLSSLVVVPEEGDESKDLKTVAYEPIAADGIGKALDGEKPKLAEAPKPKQDVDKDIASLFADLRAEKLTGATKSIEMFQPIYNKNKSLYDAVKNAVGPHNQLACSVITLSACQDSQTTPAGSVYSLFTYNLMTAWNSGAFDSSYDSFHRQLKSVSPPDSTPAINTYGNHVAEARLFERPLVM